MRVPSTSAVRARLRAGIRKSENWVELIKFILVGGSGYAVNLAVFAFATSTLSLHHLGAATVAFAVAVLNNFWWNRHWTFGASDGHAGFQAARFFAVSLFAFIFAAAVLEGLVVFAEMPPIGAQAIAIVVATPLNFVGNKMWSFAQRTSASRA